MQSSLRTSNPYALSPAYRIRVPIEGTVVRVHFPQDSTNRSRREIEYDIAPSVDGIGLIRNAPLAMGLHGILDDEEVLLKPAALIVSGENKGAYDLNREAGGLHSDGDRVIVQFINGSFLNPVITNILTHTQRTRRDNVVTQYRNKLEMLTQGPVNADGYVFGTGDPGSTAVELQPAYGNRFRHHRINGTHLALDGNGDVFLNFCAHPDDKRDLPAGAVNKKLVVQNEGKDLLRIERTGAGFEIVLLEGQAGEDLTFQVGEDTTLEVKRTGGDWTMKLGDGAKHVAIVEALQTLWGNLKTALDLWGGAAGHIHTTGVGPSGPPTPAISTPAWDPAIKSTKVSIPNG